MDLITVVFARAQTIVTSNGICSGGRARFIRPSRIDFV